MWGEGTCTGEHWIQDTAKGCWLHVQSELMLRLRPAVVLLVLLVCSRKQGNLKWNEATEREANRARLLRRKTMYSWRCDMRAWPGVGACTNEEALISNGKSRKGRGFSRCEWSRSTLTGWQKKQKNKKRRHWSHETNPVLEIWNKNPITWNSSDSLVRERPKGKWLHSECLKDWTHFQKSKKQNRHYSIDFFFFIFVFEKLAFCLHQLVQPLLWCSRAQCVCGSLVALCSSLQYDRDKKNKKSGDTVLMLKVQ